MDSGAIHLQHGAIIIIYSCLLHCAILDDLIWCKIIEKISHGFWNLKTFNCTRCGVDLDYSWNRQEGFCEIESQILDKKDSVQILDKKSTLLVLQKSWWLPPLLSALILVKDHNLSPVGTSTVILVKDHNLSPVGTSTVILVKDHSLSPVGTSIVQVTIWLVNICSSTTFTTQKGCHTCFVSIIKNNMLLTLMMIELEVYVVDSNRNITNIVHQLWCSLWYQFNLKK